MKEITGPQQAAMIRADKQGPVIMVRTVTATALIGAGFAVQTRLSRHDERGISIKLTEKGKRWVREGGSQNIG